MKVLVDTSVWSLALRRAPKSLSPAEQALRDELAELIREDRALLVGPVRQELLSGFRDDTQFQHLREFLRAFDDVILETWDYEEAAQACNLCRAAGVAGSSVDFLICAVAIARNWPVFTSDRDFLRYSRHLPLKLHAPR